LDRLYAAKVYLQSDEATANSAATRVVIDEIADREYERQRADLHDGESERDSNVVEVHINRLRRKLGGHVIQTRRGQGYLFTGRG
ncbi:MAG: helix-turn-helix domain-containing protein, partial [Alloalcanivorax venustensis]